jgi:enoyl-CoA hydratase
MELGSYKNLQTEIDDSGIAVVTLNRPPVNAVSQEMYREIRSLFEQLTTIDSLKVVILRGEGKHFCGGNDLKEFMTLSPENAAERMKEVREAFWSILDCRVPVIAAVQGVAVGTGLGLIASSDFAVAADGAKVGVPEIGVGVMGGGKHLMRLLPQPLVRWMFYSGDPVGVEELLPYGAVVAVVPPAELMDEARRRAETIARHSLPAIHHAKISLNEAEFTDLKTGYELEQGYTGELCGYADSKEAIQAFFERRDPVYTDS